MIIGKPKSDNTPLLQIDERQIERVSHFKILGLQLSDNLLWDWNVEYICNKISSKLSYILKCLASVRLCLLRSQQALTIYTSDRLRCCDQYIQCQRSLAVKPLNSTRDVGLPVSQGNCV